MQTSSLKLKKLISVETLVVTTLDNICLNHTYKNVFQKYTYLSNVVQEL